MLIAGRDFIARAGVQFDAVERDYLLMVNAGLDAKGYMAEDFAVATGSDDTLDIDGPDCEPGGPHVGNCRHAATVAVAEEAE